MFSAWHLHELMLIIAGRSDIPNAAVGAVNPFEGSSTPRQVQGQSRGLIHPIPPSLLTHPVFQQDDVDDVEERNQDVFYGESNEDQSSGGGSVG